MDPIAGNNHGLLELLHANAELLTSARRLLSTIDLHVYNEPAPGPGRHRPGPQFRHVINFYECLLDGHRTGFIDYDKRSRERSVETDPLEARKRMAAICDTLLNDSSLRTDKELLVSIEDAPTPRSDSAVGLHPLRSSLGRELQAVRSHTIHHFALIAMTLQAWGISVDAHFGVAPSTLRYRSNAGEAA